MAFGLFWIAATDTKFLHKIDISQLRESAWRVMNSDFSTAFAVIWIVSLFYGGTQVQRRKEAEKNYSIVSREAEWKEDAEKQKMVDEANRELRTQLMRAQKSLERIKFGALNNYLSNELEEDYENTYELNARFSRIHEEAKRKALGTADLELPDYKMEIERLARYTAVPNIALSTVASPKRDFIAFLKVMLDDPGIAENLSGNWKPLADALVDNNFLNFTTTLKTLDLEES
ncbi:MAG: hypothetical protein AAFQ85_01365 [Pseudomonadota bacterium]